MHFDLKQRRKETKKKHSTKRNFKDFSKSNNHKQHRVEQTRLQVISLQRKHIERAFAYRLLLKWDRFTRVKNAFHILSHKEKRLSFYNGYKSWQKRLHCLHFAQKTVRRTIQMGIVIITIIAMQNCLCVFVRVESSSTIFSVETISLP